MGIAKLEAKKLLQISLLLQLCDNEGQRSYAKLDSIKKFFRITHEIKMTRDCCVCLGQFSIKIKHIHVFSTVMW